MKISKILHLAADEYLWCGTPLTNCIMRYSCCAIEEAIFGRYGMICPSPRGIEIFDNTFDFISSLGLVNSCHQQFGEFEDDEQCQGARYLWLKFAALVAEEEGL